MFCQLCQLCSCPHTCVPNVTFTFLFLLQSWKCAILAWGETSTLGCMAETQFVSPPYTLHIASVDALVKLLGVLLLLDTSVTTGPNRWAMLPLHNCISAFSLEYTSVFNNHATIYATYDIKRNVFWELHELIPVSSWRCFQPCITL